MRISFWVIYLNEVLYVNWYISFLFSFGKFVLAWVFDGRSVSSSTLEVAAVVDVHWYRSHIFIYN